MVLLKQNENVRVPLTLQELALTTLPNNWLFVFSLEQNDGYTYKGQLLDTSDYPDSYNLFQIKAGTTFDFELEGDYQMWVYQMPNDTSVDETEGHLVHTGQIRLITVETEVPTFTVNTDEKIYKRNS